MTAPPDGIHTIRRGLAQSSPRRCYICHEIGRGSYYAYLWGAELKAYFELPASGHMLATNLHADTYEQARRQICDDNSILPASLRRMNLMLFLAVRRSAVTMRREVSTVWESDGRDDHRLVFTAGCGAFRPDDSRLVSAEDFAAAHQRIKALVASGARSIEQVRAAVITHGSPPGDDGLEPPPEGNLRRAGRWPACVVGRRCDGAYGTPESQAQPEAQ